VTYRSSSPRESIDRGIGFLTEDRNQEGLVLGHSVLSNITMPTLADFLGKLKFIDFDQEKKAGSKEVEKYAIAVPSLGVDVNNLSGGNQQKVLFARWARACEGILILDEPTRGVDVGAKVEIYRIIRELANEGVAILMISSELPEIVGMCDRVIVIREGWVTGELTGEAITEEAIMHMATMMIREETIKNGNSNKEA
jgi:ribose transport system ATP-binding protein